MPVQRVLVLGATGGVGQQVVAQAVERGLEVTALVRDAAKAPPSVRAVIGDIRADPTVVRDAFVNQDAVISALGVGKSFTPDGLITQAAPFIVAAMHEHHVRRLVFTSAFGVGATWQDVPFIPRIFMRTLLREVYADKAAGEEVIRRSGLDWTIIYPTGLTDGPRTGTVRVGERLALSGFPRVSRADVAAVLLDQVDDTRFLGKGILVSA